MPRVASRAAAVAAAMLIAVAVSTGVAQALASSGQSRIGSKQHFAATVNGGNGRSHAAEIFMACFGPIQPGQMGHPLRGQSVAVKRVHGSANGAGYTGDRGTAIGAFFGAPPPRGSPASSYVRFTSYGTKAIPTSLELPCAGSGSVNFVALPLDPTSRDVSVPVTFIGQP